MMENDAFEEKEVIGRSTEEDFWQCIDLQIMMYNLKDKACQADEGVTKKYKIPGLEESEQYKNDPSISFF